MIAFLLALGFFAGNPDAPGWTGWRGPDRLARVGGPAWPENFAKLEKTWRVELGPSYSGPIVVDGKVFVTETANESNEVVRALDRASGKELWRQEWVGSMKVPFFAKENGDWIRSTPAHDGERLYVGGMRDVLVALNAKDGSVAWRIDFVAEMKSSLPTFGFVSSPLIQGDYLYAQAGGGFCKIERATGKVVWKTLSDGGGMMGSAFSSPVFASLAGREQFVVQTRTQLAGIDPLTGSVLWTQEVPHFRGMNILTPTILGDNIFTSSYSRNSYMYAISNTGDRFQSSKVWENKLKGYMSTPAVIDGHAYLHLQNQRLACIRLTDGEITWTSSRRFGKYWSMIAQEERILGLDQEGVLFLLKADLKEFKLLDEKKVSDQETWAHLAISGQDLFIRELNAMSAWAWRK